jgi:hypothetical protein
MSRCVYLWRDTSDGFKEPVKMKTAHADRCGERIEARLCLGVFDAATGLLHSRRVLFGKRSRVRTAPFAWPNAGLFGRLAGRMELHVPT